ncbi:MAG: hypothetical protein HQL50_15020, partial [Magnetococcales bacterium]|nr:hypothetical protein [Magnetococcales bacterium]
MRSLSKTALHLLTAGILVVSLALPAWSADVAANSPSQSTDVSSAQNIWDVREITQEAIVAAEERWNKEIAALPKEAADNTPDGLKRSVYKERLKLLEELKGFRSRYDELLRNQQQLTAGEKGFKQELDRMERNPEPTLPKQIDLDGLEAARKELTGAAEELDRL